MDVDQAEAFAMQPMLPDEFQHLVVPGFPERRQGREQIENLRPVSQLAACEFTDDEWVTQHL